MTDLIAEAISEWFGPRCETKDVADFPDLAGKPDSRCPACLAWEQYDEMKAAASVGRAVGGNVRPRTGPIPDTTPPEPSDD